MLGEEMAEIWVTSCCPNPCCLNCESLGRHGCPPSAPPRGPTPAQAVQGATAATGFQWPRPHLLCLSRT